MKKLIFEKQNQMFLNVQIHFSKRIHQLSIIKKKKWFLFDLLSIIMCRGVKHSHTGILPEL